MEGKNCWFSLVNSLFLLEKAKANKTFNLLGPKLSSCQRKLFLIFFFFVHVGVSVYGVLISFKFAPLMQIYFIEFSDFTYQIDLNI